jgi:hypothetical protein
MLPFDPDRDERLVLLGVLRRPGQSWRNIYDACYMAKHKSAPVRDRLVRRGALLVRRAWRLDQLGRRRLIDTYEVNPGLTCLPELQAYIAQGLTGLMPLPDPPQNPPERPLQACPGRHDDMRARLLESLLRNPTAAWRDVRSMSGMSGLEADRAIDYLFNAGVVTCESVWRVSAHRQVYCRRGYFPVETHPMVLEIRKRYGLRPQTPEEIAAHINATIAPYAEKPQLTEPELSWREQLQRALANEQQRALAIQREISRASEADIPGELPVHEQGIRPGETLGAMLGLVVEPAIEDVDPEDADHHGETMRGPT